MRIVLGLMAGLFATAAAAAEAPQFLLVGLDGKTFFTAEGGRNGPNGRDAVAIIDISNEANPRLAHTLPLDNSVYGPPTNLQITPDGRLGLVASSVLMGQEGKNQDSKSAPDKGKPEKDKPWYARPDDRLHVIDLASRPPRLVETIKVGRQPSGIAIDRSGTFALVANREGRSVTMLSIRGTEVRVTDTIDVGDEVAAVAIASDGQRAFVAKNKAGKVGILRLTGKPSYDPAADMPVGPGIYGLDITPDGTLLLTANTGPEPSDGHADTLSVIRAAAYRPVVVDHVGIGDTPEALAISPDGRHAAVAVVRGAAAAHSSPNYTTTGVVSLVTIDRDGRLRRTGEASAGAVTQGIAFSPSGRFVYVGNYVDRTLGVYRLDGDTLVETGVRVTLPGQPASLRGRAAQ